MTDLLNRQLSGAAPAAVQLQGTAYDAEASDDIKCQLPKLQQSHKDPLSRRWRMENNPLLRLLRPSDNRHREKCRLFQLGTDTEELNPKIKPFTPPF